MNFINLLFTHGYINGGVASVASAGVGVVLIMLTISLLALASRVLFALAAYHDACAKSNPDAVMWGLLIGFLGLIPGIIYLCVRNSSRSFVACPNCGFRHYFYDMNCPRCGAPNQNSTQNANPMAAQQAHRAKVLFIIAIVLTGVVILTAIVCVVSFAANIFSVSGNSIYY
nr:hypothetical protein [uncultured Caproiciproducens sp.]